jgi:hypothetical protein
MVYQDNPPNTNLSALTADNRQRIQFVPQSEKRAYEVFGFVIEPYYNKPRMIKETMSAVDDPKRLFKKV